jgi:hypothetical protein
MKRVFTGMEKERLDCMNEKRLDRQYEESQGS